MGDHIVIPEVVIEGKRLGRHIHHDPRSLQYPFRAPTIQLVSKRWSTDTDVILDQGQLGSCTGNATVGSMICSNNNPIRAALTVAQVKTLNETLAVKIYSKGTELDSEPGTYPPTDTGSDGLSVAKAAQEFGYISSYAHAFSVQDALAALTTAPIIIGINWYEGFDSPDSTGLVKKTGTVRGGHEICVDEIDVKNSKIWFRNSWSDSWGVKGRANMTFATFQAILADQGDATVLVPVSAPAPSPVPAPPTPTPVPNPTPTPVPTPTPTPTPVVSADQALYDATTAWVAKKKFSKTSEAVRQALLAWRSTYVSGK